MADPPKVAFQSGSEGCIPVNALAWLRRPTASCSPAAKLERLDPMPNGVVLLASEVTIGAPLQLACERTAFSAGGAVVVADAELLAPPIER